MNLHAPEFVRRKAWRRIPAIEVSKVQSDSNSLIDTSNEFSCAEEKFDQKRTNKDDQRLKKVSSDAEKAELARQILLSFIVKSVSDAGGEPEVNENSKFTTGNSSEEIANDSAIAKILSGNEGKMDLVSQSDNVK
ncbi:hypothetical protein LguiB_023132 [Lonicera macranthoides]